MNKYHNNYYHMQKSFRLTFVHFVFIQFSGDQKKTSILIYYTIMDFCSNGKKVIL